MDRRDFLKTVGISGPLLTLPGYLRAGSRPSGARPNIVLVMVDDMGYSDLGCMGSEIQTPNLDRLAGGGLKFTQFYNAARCCPTRASLLTGLYPHQAGVGHMTGDVGKPGYRGYLSEHCVTISEALKAAGYHTLMAGKWHVGDEQGKWPVDRGFDEYFGILKGACNYFKPNPKGMLARNYELVESGEGFYTTDAFTDHAIQFINEYNNKDGKPYFLYLAYNAPHWPLHAKPEDIAKYKGRYIKGWDVLRQERYERQIEMGVIDKKWPLSERDRAAPSWNSISAKKKQKMADKMEVYAAMVDSMDQNIGRLLQAIERTGQMDNTLIMFLSDNGACHESGAFGWESVPTFATPEARKARMGTPESFASYGRSWSNASNTPFRLHKHWTHEGGISTPLLVRWPRVIKQGGQLTDQPGHIIDIMATCLDAANAPYPETYKGAKITPLEGKSLVPVFEGRTREGHEAIFWEHEGNRAVRKGKWKLVSDYPFGWQLFDMQADRTESTNLALKNPKVVKELSRMYKAYTARSQVQPWNYLWVLKDYG